MRNVLRIAIPLLIIIATSPMLPTPGLLAQEADPVATWLRSLNQARLDNGLVPYSLSRLLTTAAQRHADDIAAHGLNPDDPHRGSDGSLPAQRIAAAGYAAWTMDSGESFVGESIWVGEMEEGLASLLQDPAESDKLLSPLYREVGIGVATDTAGQRYSVLTFGARPNVLPIFINDDAVTTDDPLIALHLSNEDVQPKGQGTIFMGRAIEIRISNEPHFEDLPWQPWKQFVPWTLPNVPGEHTVYVQFRDAAGRTAASADTIMLGESTAPVPETTPELLPHSPTPPSELMPTPPTTAEHLPVPEVTVTPRPLQPSPTPLAQMPLPFTTLFPTWTPLPTERPLSTEYSAPQDSPSWTLTLRERGITLALVLQMVVLVLGIYKILRRN